MKTTSAELAKVQGIKNLIFRVGISSCIIVARKRGQHKLYPWHVCVAGLRSGSHMQVKVQKYRSRLWPKPFENLLSN